MKPMILVLLVAAVTIVGCSTSKMAHVPFEYACTLTSNYLTHPSLSKIFKDQALGGTIPAQFFNVSKDSSGIIFWFCYKPGKNPELFLAMQQLKQWDTTKLPVKPTGNFLVKSTMLFKYNGAASAAKNDVANYFIGHTETNNGYESISHAQVQSYVDSFDSLMNANRDAKGNKYSNYSFCYFDKVYDFQKGPGYLANTDYDDFLKQTPPNGFVRYYFGYNEFDNPNRLRVILFSANAGGTTITSKASSVIPDAEILQRSFPPPPYN